MSQHAAAETLIGPGGGLGPVAAHSLDDLMSVLGSALSARTGIPAAEIAAELVRRERLGSTGLGAGLAVPHARFSALRTCTAVIASVRPPVAFSAPDGEPVDLVVALLSPQEAGADHLQALAAAGRLFRDPWLVAALREAPDAGAMQDLLCRGGWSKAAA